MKFCNCLHSVHAFLLKTNQLLVVLVKLMGNGERIQAIFGNLLLVNLFCLRYNGNKVNIVQRNLGGKAANYEGNTQTALQTVFD
jgi:hypothetical protein